MTALSSLQQALPAVDIKDAVFVTIWFFSFLVFSLILHDLLEEPWLVRSAPKHTWSEFGLLLPGSMLLAFWYFIEVIDRWCHWSQRSVVYGYIVVEPFFEPTRIASSLLLLWVTYKVVWRELNSRLSPEPKWPRYWWLAGRMLIIVAGIISLFYWMLSVSLAGAWLNFLSLNTIADIATQRTSFDISMTALFFAFSLLTVAAAATLFYKSKRRDGSIVLDRTALYIATLLLLARSTIEFATALRAYCIVSTRRDLQLMGDISYGLITSLYLLLMAIFAWRVAGEDLGNEEAMQIQGWIRFKILEQLHLQTNDGRRQSPPFGDILDQVNNDLNAREPDQSNFTSRVGRQCIESLRIDYRNVNDARIGASPPPTPPHTAYASA